MQYTRCCLGNRVWPHHDIRRKAEGRAGWARWKDTGLQTAGCSRNRCLQIPRRPKSSRRRRNGERALAAAPWITSWPRRVQTACASSCEYFHPRPNLLGFPRADMMDEDERKPVNAHAVSWETEAPIKPPPRVLTQPCCSARSCRVCGTEPLAVLSEDEVLSIELINFALNLPHNPHRHGTVFAAQRRSVTVCTTSCRPDVNRSTRATSRRRAHSSAWKTS